MGTGETAEAGEMPAFLGVAGEMPRLIREHDWSSTLGPLATWPASLRAAVGLLIRSPVPMVLLWGEDGIMIYNDAYSAFAGGRHPALLGSKVREGWPEVADFNDNVMRVGLAGGTLAYKDQELTLYRRGRPEQVWMNLDYSPVVDDEGRPAGVIAIVVETTARVLGEAALRESEARLRFLDTLSTETGKLADAGEILSTTTRMLGQHLNLSVCAYADMDPDQDGFTIRGDWSAPGSRSIVGHYSLAAFGKLAVRNLAAGLPLVINNNLLEIAPEEAATFQAIGITATICMPLIKDGRLTALMAIHDKAPRLWQPRELALLQEVTQRSWAHVERARAEAELRGSEARYRTLFEKIDAGFCIIDMVWDEEGRPVDYVFVEANPAFERQAGFACVPGLRMREVVPNHEQFWFDLYGDVARTGATTRVEHGSAALGRWWDVHAFPMETAGRGRVAVLFNDVTLRRRSELALRQTNETLERRVAEALAERKLLADIVEGTDALVQVLDPQFRVLAINRAASNEFERIFGVRPKVGQSVLDLIGDRPREREEVRAVWARALAGEEFTQIGEFGDPTRDRRVYEMKYNVLRGPDGAQIGAYQFVYDVTERVREQERLAEAEEQLRHAQKMEAMGQLTGGVAHDFNNLLTPIVGSLDMLQRKGVGGEREQRLIAGAIQSAERARTLVQRLLAFARRQPLQPVPVDLGRLVQGMAELIASTTGPQIRVVVDVAADLPPAEADPNQIEMALLNLSVNARDAMPDGGVLRISAFKDVIGPGHRSKLRPGTYVRLSVADTGQGMDEETMARAVEPFFSTKGIGKGTGLGLSMVHGLALQLDGALSIHSQVGVGTNVELWLPRSHADPAPGVEASRAAAAPSARGTALLVEDEELVRLSTAEMLADLGFAVREAANAEDALRLVDAGLRPSIVVTDHLMPGMTGTQLARILRARSLALPVLVVSGYAESDGIDQDLARLTKPFRQSELSEAVLGLLKPA